MSLNEFHLTNGDVVVTDGMLEEFRRDGYVVIRSLLDAEEVAKVVRVLETSDMTSHEYGRPDRQGKQPRLILWQHPGSDVTGMVARCEKIVNTCEKLLGGEVYHYHTKLNSKEPNIGGKFEWHQDYGYWYKYGCLFPDMMTTFIALTSCDETNGCMQVLNGSHKCGRIEHTIVGDQTGADLDRVRLVEERCQRVIVELQPGDALLFHSNVLHTSSENTSDTWRRALLIAYNRASNNPVNGIKHPDYTPLQKVPNDAIRECDNYTDFSDYHYEIGKWEVTEEMIHEFDENGYIIVRGLLNNIEVDKVKTALLDNGMVRKYGYLIPDAQGRSPIITIWKHPGNDVTGMLARCEKVVTTSEKLLGVEELYHYHGKCLLKEPRIGGTFEWHQDYGYWYVYCLKPDMMAVLVAVDECTPENGGLQVLKGSHKCGRIDHGFVAGQQGANMGRVESIKSRCELVHTNLQPGDAVFFHSNLLHYSGPNNSDKRRLVVNISYNERSNEPFRPNICPQYTKIQKVEDTALVECTNLDDFTGKIFIKGDDDELVNSEPTPTKSDE